MNSPGIYIEISQTTLRALHGETGLEIPLERASNGRLTETSRQKLTDGLRDFLPHKTWQMRPRAYGAIGARGVSLRKLTIPSVRKEELHRLLLMQIESEFPLSPGELAWGYRSLGETHQNGTAKQDLLVLAVKKDVVEEYSAILSGCGVIPVFTLAAMARSGIVPQPLGSYAILEVGQQSSELILFEQGVPMNVRSLSFSESQPASAEGLTSFAKALNGSWSGKKLFVAGSDASFKAVESCLTERFSSGVECEPLKFAGGRGHSSAVLGLRKSMESDESRLIFFQSQQESVKAANGSPAPLKWTVLVGALVLALLLLPYAEALLLKPWIEKKFAALKADQGRLAVIDQELDFLQTLKQSQPPYLDSLYLFAKSAPQGSKIDSMTMNRRGEVSIRASMRNGDQVAEFRNKLIASGFFSNVAVEEQTPTPDKQKVNIRVAAQWKPLSVLQTLAVGPTAEEIEKAKAKKDSGPGGMPGGFPPGMMPPGAMPAGFSPDMMPPGAMPTGLPPGVRISPAVRK
jgi:hypothetical protein